MKQGISNLSTWVMLRSRGSTGPGVPRPNLILTLAKPTLPRNVRRDRDQKPKPFVHGRSRVETTVAEIGTGTEETQHLARSNPMNSPTLALGEPTVITNPKPVVDPDSDRLRTDFASGPARD